MGDDPHPPFDEESNALRNLSEVVWSIVGDCDSKRNDDHGDDLEEVLRQAAKFTNITGGVLDDFFKPDGTGRYSVNEITRIKEKLHNFPMRKLDLWMVWYEIQLDFDVRKYLDLCDVITFWTWRASNLKKLDENMEKVKAMTPGKRRLAGCYMWDYGAQKALSVEEMELQCGKYRQWMIDGTIDGVIFCSNCIMDIGLDAVEWTKQWIKDIETEDVGKSANF
jgi:hypothetical protein